MPEWAREAVARLAALARVPAALGRKNENLTSEKAENLTSEKANYPRCSRRSSRPFDWRRLAGGIGKTSSGLERGRCAKTSTLS